MTRSLLPLLGCAAAAVAALAAPAVAQARPGASWPAASAGDGAGGAGLVLIQQRQLSLRDVAQIIEARVPGRLSDAQLVEQGGRTVYIIRWEPSDDSMRGRILIFVVDAETGSILSRRGG